MLRHKENLIGAKKRRKEREARSLMEKKEELCLMGTHNLKRNFHNDMSEYHKDWLKRQAENEKQLANRKRLERKSLSMKKVASQPKKVKIS